MGFEEPWRVTQVRWFDPPTELAETKRNGWWDRSPIESSYPEDPKLALYANIWGCAF